MDTDISDEVAEYRGMLMRERYSETTMRGYTWVVASALTTLRSEGLASTGGSIGDAEVAHLRDVHWAHLPRRTVAQNLCILRGYLRWRGNDALDSVRIVVPPDARVHVDWLEPHEAAVLESHAEGIEAVVVHLELRMGLRRREVSELRTGDIDPRGRGSMVVRGKGRGGPKLRTVPFHHRTREVLDDWAPLRESIAESADDDTVVPDNLLLYRHMGRVGHPRRTAMDNVLRRVSDRSGIRCAHHTLRRTFGRMHWLAGTKTETISAMMGHSDVAQTLRYIGVRLDDMGEAMDRMRDFEGRL